MSHIDKRGDRYRARFCDPTGTKHSRTFRRKSDAQTFLRELESDMLRGVWVDPRDADMALADWVDEFLSLCRRLAERTQETYRRDLTKYVLPRFGAYRLGHLPADEIENWLNDEIDAGIAPSSVHRHYRTLRRVLQVAVEKQKLVTNPCDRVDPPSVPKREMVFLDWDEAMTLADHLPERYRTMIVFGRQRHAVERDRRPPPPQDRPRPTKGQSDRAVGSARGRIVCQTGAEKRRPGPGRSRSRPSPSTCSTKIWLGSQTQPRMDWCSRTAR